MEAEMQISCVPPQHDGGYKPASTAAVTASAIETAHHEKGSTQGVQVVQECCPATLNHEDGVDMSSYFADWAPKRLNIIKKGFHDTTYAALRAEARDISVSYNGLNLQVSSFS